MRRTILHADLNSFYSSVESLHHPEFRGQPLAVGGDAAARHGIILAKNELAKAYGIQTGDVLWAAQRKCPQLVIIPADFERYLRFSGLVKKIFAQYSDQVESFGIDECWLDITSSLQRQSGQAVADEIRQRVKAELGLTLSVGVSWNKIFAKLGSDLHKPDATTVIDENNFQQVVWPLSVSELLYVGKATAHKLNDRSIRTIGELARTPPEDLRRILGKWGEILWVFANGYDDAPVAEAQEAAVICSIGNSITLSRDILCRQEAQMVMTVLAESVAARLRANGFKCTGVAIQVRDNRLSSWSRQRQLPAAAHVTTALLEAAMLLIDAHVPWERPLRSLGLRAIGLVPAAERQLSLFEDSDQYKAEQLENTLDELRRRFGNKSVVRANTLLDRSLTGFDPQREHVIHPLSYF